MFWSTALDFVLHVVNLKLHTSETQYYFHPLSTDCCPTADSNPVNVITTHDIIFSVTIARAIELKHSASIVSALAHETAKLFEATGIRIRQMYLIYLNI